MITDEVKPMKPSEYSALYKRMKQDFKKVDAPTYEFKYSGHKMHIQVLPFIHENGNPIVRYRIIYPQGYVSTPNNYNGIIDLPFWAQVENEIVNVINNHYYK